MQERDIFVSLKNADKNSIFISSLHTTLTDKLNELLAVFFKSPSNGGLDIQAPNHSTSQLANSNIMLSFKTKDGAQLTRTHVDSWIKFIDPRATTPHHTFTVVAHNTPASIWSDPMLLREAMMEIETTNTDIAPIDFTVAKLVWLNSQEAWSETWRGPLMISFQSKNSTNAAIDLNLAIHGVTCSVSIYIPWPL